MHIDRTNQVTVADKATLLTVPNPAFGLVLVSTSGTLARCSSFGASEAQDAGSFRFVGQIVTILAVFPQGHALIVVPASIAVTDAVRIADEETSHLVLNTEVYHLAGGFVPHISDTAFRAQTYFMLGTLQLLPPTRILLAVSLRLRQLAQMLVALPLETADTTPCDNHGLACVGGDGGKMDFAQINGSLVRTCGIFCLWYLDAHVQFKAVLPDERACSTVLRQRKRQNERLPAFAHGQHHTPALFGDGLSGPHHGIEPLGPPGVFHAHVGMGFAQLTRGEDSGKEGMHDHLDELAMQGKPSLGRLLQLGASRPQGMRYACLLVGLHALVPDLSRFHLGGFQTLKKRGREHA
jgi:hypothetical protein